MMKSYYIKHINNPYLNKLLSPETNLYRPQLRWLSMIALSSFILVIIFLLTQAIFFLAFEFDKYICGRSIDYFIIFSSVSIVLICIFSKYYFIFAVKIYQRYAKASTRLKCCCYPSCSEYAIIALRKYGSVAGCILAIKHCIRCKPPGIYEFP